MSFLRLPKPVLVLLGLELRELLTARSLWVMLLLLCPLMGYSFIQSVNLYSEASRTALQFPELANDNVKAYAYFPFAIDKNVQDFRQGKITVRFKPIDGRIDQGAGIVFNLKPNGDYLIIRANALENNLVLFKYEKGQRSSVEWVRNTPTATRQWHELKVSVTGDQVKGYLDGKLYLQHTLPAPVSGKVGVWSKADSVVYFDDFRVTPSG